MAHRYQVAGYVYQPSRPSTRFVQEFITNDRSSAERLAKAQFNHGLGGTRVQISSIKDLGRA